jgi:hypothetical protein
MVGVGFTKMKKGIFLIIKSAKQFAMLGVTMYAADIFIQRRKSNDIFYEIPELKVKEL